MSASSALTVGLAPALTVEEPIRFGPLTLSPVGQDGDGAFREVAARFACERGAHSDHQALVSCPPDLRSLVPTIWPLFVFGCVTYARRRRRAGHGVAFSENFHLPLITKSPDGWWAFDSGQTMGLGRAEHLPLTWAADSAASLRDGCWDRRFELACSVLARDPEPSSVSAVAVAAGMAADLACAAIERRNQKVQNVATGARAYVLLGTAFEALHRRGSDKRHHYNAVIGDIARLEAGHTALGARIFSKHGLSNLPGTVATRPMLAVAQLFYIRNLFAHGREPIESEYVLPADLNGCELMHAATLILAALIGDDLSLALGCAVPGAISEMMKLHEKIGLPFESLCAALTDSRDLLSCLENAITPKSGDASENSCDD
jgi:hypothetical protein